jgi:peptidoglycan-associated lipoprotein
MRQSSSIFVFVAIAVVLAIILAGCTHHTKPTVEPVSSIAAPPSRATTAPPAAKADVQPASSHLGVGGDLIAACQLHFAATAEAPEFDFDQSSLAPDDRAVLDEVAQCLTSGPLAGRTVTLTGRADPRGTEEYNLALGQRRAASVSEYLSRLGVAAAHLDDTTRGALDATGHDEASWREDRRVDLTLRD